MMPMHFGVIHSAMGDQTTTDVDKRDIVRVDTVGDTFTNLAVDDIESGSFISPQACLATVVHPAVGDDHHRLVVGEHAAVLLTVREDAEVHK